MSLYGYTYRPENAQRYDGNVVFRQRRHRHASHVDRFDGQTVSGVVSSFDCSGLVTVDVTRTSPQAPIRPFTPFTWFMYALTVFSLYCP
jgi:hypothetical protein